MGRRQKRLSDQPFEVEISALDTKGLGKTVHEGKNLRVFDALPGEKVMARYLFGRSQRGKAETVEVLQASADRVEPRCPHFGYCGACSMQHISEQAQQESKLAGLLKLLDEAGTVKPQEIYPTLSGEAWNYRRKARLSVRDVPAKERVLVGFRERNGRFVADMNECHILRHEIADAIPRLSELIGQLDARSTIPQIEVACGDQQSALVFRHLEALSEHDLAVLADFAKQSGIGIYLQSAGPDSVELLAPDNFQLHYAIPELDLNYHFEPLDFTQVNGDLNREMVARALELLNPQADDHVLDLFCGLGNFTLALARRAGRVTGVEGSQQMVERGTENAALNELDNVEFFAVDLYKQPAEPATEAPWPAADYSSILLDPPRSGALELLPWIGASQVERVVYVSCSSLTLARDAAVLVNEHGFVLKGVGIMDMFPHTRHSEVIALFERNVRDQQLE